MHGSVLYPHKTLTGDLNLILDRVHLDDQLLPSEKIQSPFNIADLGRTGDSQWQSAKMDFSLRYQPDKAKETIANFTSSHGELRAWLALECRPTNLRISLKLNRSKSDQMDQWSGTLIVDRDHVIATAIVQAWLAYDLAEPGIPFKSRVAAESSPWTIYLDPPRSFHRDGGMQMHWVDFSNYADLDWLSHYQNAFSAIDMSPETPRILLNSTISGFQEILKDETAGQDPARDTLRNMAANNVARGAWMALAHQSIQSLRKSGGELANWSAPAWQREVMEILALILGPNLKLSDWLENEGGDWIHEGLTPANWTRLDVALGDWMARRSNLAAHWQKWSKTQSKIDPPEAEVKKGFVDRLKTVLKVKKKAEQEPSQLFGTSDE